VLNKTEKKEPKKDWQTILANMGQIKKTFKKAVEQESHFDKKLIKRLLSKKDFNDYKDRKF